MSVPVRNRIKAHRRVRAGDLVPHELNFRAHPDLQRAALRAIYSEVGFARSLLAYELPDGRLKLLDGHLRRDLDPDMEVDVEVVDVNDDPLMPEKPFAANGSPRVWRREDGTGDGSPSGDRGQRGCKFELSGCSHVRASPALCEGQRRQPANESRNCAAACADSPCRPAPHV